MKNEKKSLIVLAVMLVMGLIGFFVGMYIAGYDVASWFWNPTSWLVYLLLILASLYGGFYLWAKKK